MQFITAKNDLLLTERIEKKPMLRTRFTNQAYFVLAALLDLIDQRILSIRNNQLAIENEEKLTHLPAYLNGLKAKITAAVKQKQPLETALDFITSWDIANEIYDGIGSELLESGLVEKTSVKTNLDTHVIYLPTAAARNQVITSLKEQMKIRKMQPSAINLVIIYEQLNALKWLFQDKTELAELTRNFHQNVDSLLFYQQKNRLVKIAQEIITKKKFWYDSWLS
ncbi:hypothetical protein YK48G_13880 [Lentilactobacillus fungorum]|uniref:Uncharacterized protein n=1 Tax=Lentilactobacillus fungorum TaxID=2201250 RepID=A0ABQ3VZ14_9LACO|nr:hypothetical protein [Lentilactobacillus fungorum]GHP13963.1 hypothetical protein YK48G_13880 [Lentilactobacillus fungorum]